MAHSSAIFSANVVSTLRQEEFDRPATSDEHIVPGCYFNWDSEQGNLTIDMTSKPGELFHLKTKVRQAPRWFSLNLSLGEAAFAPGDVLGIVVEGRSTNALELIPFIRSAAGGELTDTLFEEHIKISAGHMVCTALHTVLPENGVASLKGYHTLVFRLPGQDFELTLEDLRFFVIPAARGLTTRPVTLANAAF